MKTEFNIPDLLSANAYTGLPFTGENMSVIIGKRSGKEYTYEGDAASKKMMAQLGAPLRKRNALGQIYFLPVLIEHKNGTCELPNASIGFQGKKKIVETPMAGRKGTVKELISIEDYTITISGVYLDTDFPEQGLQELEELFEQNESVKLICALTDIFLAEDDKVVIQSINIPAETGTDTAQRFTITLITDKNFELIAE